MRQPKAVRLMAKLLLQAKPVGLRLWEAAWSYPRSERFPWMWLRTQRVPSAVAGSCRRQPHRCSRKCRCRHQTIASSGLLLLLSLRRMATRPSLNHCLRRRQLHHSHLLLQQLLCPRRLLWYTKTCQRNPCRRIELPARRLLAAGLRHRYRREAVQGHLLRARAVLRHRCWAAEAEL